MEKYLKIFKIKQLVQYLAITLTVLIVLLIDAANINYAKVVDWRDFSFSNPTNIVEKEFAYTFKIPDKLDGTGEMRLKIDRNKIKGIALGKGKTCKGIVDFHTNIEGTVDKLNGEVSVLVAGEGTPLIIPVPCKIKFQGPLKGNQRFSKLSLIGKVNIKGNLASLAGFKKTENLIIEVPIQLLSLNKL